MLSKELPAGDEGLQAQRWTPAPLWHSAAKPGPHTEDLAAWSASIYRCTVLSSRQLALPALPQARGALAVFMEMTTTGEVVGGETPFFDNGTDVRTLVQSTRDTDFRFLRFKPRNHTSLLLGDNWTSRISDREDSAVAEKKSSTFMGQRKEHREEPDSVG